jgi:hypothetical protein
LGGVAAAAVAPFVVQNAKPAPIPVSPRMMPAGVPYHIAEGGCFAGLKRSDYPPLTSVLIMSPAQARAYEQLGYNVRG